MIGPTGTTTKGVVTSTGSSAGSRTITGTATCVGTITGMGTGVYIVAAARDARHHLRRA